MRYRSFNPAPTSRDRTRNLAGFVRVVAVMAGVACLVGCASNHPVDPDVLTDDSYRTDWVQDGIYRTTVPLFLIDQGSGRVRYELAAERAKYSTGGAPHTIEDYIRDGPKRWPRVRAVLPVGARLQFKGVRITGNWWEGRYAHPLALILERDMTNLGLVDLYALYREHPWDADERFSPITLRDPERTEPVSLTSPFHTPAQAAAATRGTDPTDPTSPATAPATAP